MGLGMGNGILVLYLIEYNAIIYYISLDIEFFLVQVYLPVI